MDGLGARPPVLFRAVAVLVLFMGLLLAAELLPATGLRAGAVPLWTVLAMPQEVAGQRQG